MIQSRFFLFHVIFIITTKITTTAGFEPTRENPIAF